MKLLVFITFIFPICVFSQKEMCSYDTTFNLRSSELFVHFKMDSLEVQDYFTNEIKNSSDFQIQVGLDSCYEYIINLKIIFDFETSRELKMIDKVAICTLSNSVRHPLFWIYKEELPEEIEVKIKGLLCKQTSICDNYFYSFWEEE